MRFLFKRKFDIGDRIDYDDCMASITIRNLPDRTKEKLRVDAAKSGISLEGYARRILKEASGDEEAGGMNLRELARECFGEGDGVDLDLPARGSRRGIVEFD